MLSQCHNILFTTKRDEENTKIYASGNFFNKTEDQTELLFTGSNKFNYKPVMYKQTIIILVLDEFDKLFNIRFKFL